MPIFIKLIYKGARPHSNYDEVPVRLIKIKYMRIRVEKVSSPITALQSLRIVSPQKTFSDFNEIWCVHRAR